METYVNDNAELLWKLFVANPTINMYMLYSAVQHDRENIAQYDVEDNTNYNNYKDDGMEM